MRVLTRLARALVPGLALLVASAASAATLRTITIDGDLGDWAEVLLDPAQTVADRSLEQGDPDLPGQSQRDERGAAFTWDADRLYLYFSRTGSGTNSFNAVFWFDVDHDGVLEAADRLAFFRFSGSSFGGLDVNAWGGADFVLQGDGVEPNGPAGTLLTTLGATAAADPAGIRFEASLEWGALGLGGPQPMILQAGISSNQNLPGGLEDVTDLLDTHVPAVAIAPGTTKGAGPGRSADFAHRVTNLGTAGDELDLSLRSILGFALEVHSDPDGDGDPSDGALVARDVNGDGDFTDLLDLPPAPAADTNGDGLPDGGTLAAGEGRDWVVRALVPADQAVGTEDVVRVVVASDYRPSVRRSADDRVRVNLVTLTPPGETVATSGLEARFRHLACNHSGAGRVLELTATTTRGWATSTWSDPDGDGDPADGAPLADSDGDGLPDLGFVADGSCASVVIDVELPPAVPAGDGEEVTVVLADGPVADVAGDRIDVVASRVDVAPDRAARGQRGKYVFLAHRLTNADVVSETYSLAALPAGASTADALDDPDGDGEPGDSAPLTSLGPVAGHGGAAALITRVRLPVAAVHGQVETVALEAVADGSGASDRAVDSIEVAGLLTYADPLFARPSTTFFGQCATIHVLAFRDDSSDYRFRWLDPVGAVMRSSADLRPYSDGSLDDFFHLGGAPAVGTWTVKLQRRSGSGYVDVGPAGLQTFDVLDLVTGGAEIRSLDTGSDVYELTGEDFVGFSEARNPTFADVLDSALDYVVWRDANGDGSPSAGEDWLRDDGTIQPWSAGLLTRQRRNVDVLAEGSFGDRFAVPSVTWSQNGPWLLQATWLASCGFVLDVRVHQFTVGCEPAPTFSGLQSAVDTDACEHAGVLLTWPAATDWGLGTGGTYAVYRSTDPLFEPGPETRIASGLTDLSFLDAGVPPEQTWYWVVRAESDVTCSTGPNNRGLLDGNLRRQAAADQDIGVIPVAGFARTEPACTDGGPLTVAFTDASLGPPSSWAWDFDGDGLPDASGAAASWTFDGPGTYDVSLTVTNACGADTVVLPVQVHESPAAIPQASRPATCVGEPVDFDGTASEAYGGLVLVAWEWDFDGDTVADSAEADPPPHGYAAPGAYDAHLTVTDSAGCMHEATVPVTVASSLTVELDDPVVDHCTGEVVIATTVAGGQPPHAWSWNVLTDDGAGTGSGALPLGSTQVVEVTVTDAAGCVAVASTAPLAILPELEVSLAEPAVDPCTGAVSLTATATGGDGAYDFDFDLLTDDGAGRGTGTLPPGTHVVTVTATDGNDCAAVAASAVIEVPARLVAVLDWTVEYVGSAQYLAHLSGSAAGGVPATSLSWDLDDDGTVDATGPTLDLPLGANDGRVVALIATDGNDCVTRDVRTITSGGCPADRELTGLRVARDGAGLLVTWDASSHACHVRYEAREAFAARPAALPGDYPTDPDWRSLTAEDQDGSDQDPSLTLADDRPGRATVFFLVRDGGSSGNWGPVGHYGR